MIYNIIVWTILTVVCLICGNGILNYFNIDFLRVGDRFILSIWLGIIAFIIIFLGLSFIVPLSTTTGVITFLFAILFILLIPKNRQNLWSIYNFIELKKILFYYLLSITLAIIINKPIKWFDTGLYHWHSIKWLSNFGTVTGLALINSKHGFNAGWFAFSASLHLFLLDSHVSGVSNGFIFLIAIIHFCLSSQYLLTAQNQISDWFITFYNLLVCSTYIATIFTDSPILISYSPDVFVNILIGVIAWVTLTISQQQKESGHKENRKKSIQLAIEQ